MNVSEFHGRGFMIGVSLYVIEISSLSLSFGGIGSLVSVVVVIIEWLEYIIIYINIIYCIILYIIEE